MELSMDFQGIDLAGLLKQAKYISLSGVPKGGQLYCVWTQSPKCELPIHNAKKIPQSCYIL